MASAADKKRWDKLHADLAKADAERDDLEITLRVKYGSDVTRPSNRHWMSRTERTKLEKIEARVDKIHGQIYELVERISPRDWGHGVPGHWVTRKLTWEDAVRPKGEPLSVVVPGAYGYPDGYMKETASARTTRTHRGFKIETVDATQLGYRLPSGDPGKGRKKLAFYIYAPDDPERPIKTVDSLRKAIEYIDNYLGDDEGVAEKSRQTRESTMKIEIPDMEQWTQIGGDMDPGAHGGTIARSDGDRLELLMIQPVREYVGDAEAAEVGFPFWTREASFDLDDLDPSSKEVQSALNSIGMSLDDLAANPGDRTAAGETGYTPQQRALVIAEALLDYGHADEGPSGWAADIIHEPVKWWSGAVAGAEYIADEDDEFRREVLGEEDEEEEEDDEDDEEEFEEPEYSEPTTRDVIDAFKDYFEHEGLDASEESARIARLMSSAAGNAKRADKALDEINEIIGGHGVEAINGDHHVDNYYGDTVALYVNTGDTYNSTVLYETEEGRFFVTSFGEWVEAYQDKYDIR